MRDADFFRLQNEVRDCKAAIKVLADGIRELRGRVAADVDRVGQAQDRAESNERASHAENITLRASNLAMRAVVDAAVKWCAPPCSGAQICAQTDDHDNECPVTITANVLYAAVRTYLDATKDVPK